MATSYVVRTKVTITRQAGDTGSIVFVIPDAISLATYDEALFQVRDSRDVLLFEKETPTEIVISGQNVTVNLLALDTTGVAGTYNWELELHSTTEIITVGKGSFIVLKEITV